MKKEYVKPETEIVQFKFTVPTLWGPINPSQADPGQGDIHSNERNSVFDDEPAASGEEGGYKRSLW